MSLCAMGRIRPGIASQQPLDSYILLDLRAMASVSRQRLMWLCCRRRLDTSQLSSRHTGASFLPVECESVSWLLPSCPNSFLFSPHHVRYHCHVRHGP